MVRYQWAMDLQAATSQISVLRAIRERSFQVLSLFLISAKRATTSSILGRLVGSSWTISVISGCMNSRPLYFWLVEVRIVLFFVKKKKTKPDLGVIFSNQVPKVVHISGKRVTQGLLVPMLRCRLVAATQRLVEWWSIGRVIEPRVAEVDEKVSRGTSGARIPLHISAKILASPWIGRMERVWIHTRWIEHDVLICTVTVMVRLSAKLVYKGEHTDGQRDFRA